MTQAPSSPEPNTSAPRQDSRARKAVNTRVSGLRDGVQTRIGSGGGDHKETAISIAAGFAIYGLGLLTGPVVFRLLGAEGRGDVQVLMILHQLAVFLLSFGVPGAAAFYADRRDRGQLAGTGAVLSVVLPLPFVVAGWLLAPAIAGDGKEELTMWLRYAMLLVPLGIFHFFVTEILRSDAAGLAFNVHRNSPIILRALYLLVAAVAGLLTLNSALGLSVAAFVIGYVASILVVLRPQRWSFDFQLGRDLINYGLRRWMSIAANTLLVRLDQIIMIPLIPREDLGVYVVSVTVAGVLRPVSTGFGQVILPQLRRGNRSSEAVLAQSLKGSLYSVLPVASLIAATSWFLVPFVYGDGSAEAVWPLLILLPGEVAAGLANISNGYLAAQGAPGRASVSKVVSAIFTIIALLIMIPLLGIIGAAIVTTASYFLEMVVVSALIARMDPSELDIARTATTEGVEIDG